jgi:putative transposase
MSRNYYSEINLHLTWHTKQSAPLLTPRVEPVVHRLLREKLFRTEGVFVHEIGGTENHVHVAVSIAPTILISDLVGQLKGATSHEVNQLLGSRGKVLQWQTGYGVVSFGTKDLPWIKGYIRDQREHHARGNVFDRLERITATEYEAQAEAARSPVNGAPAHAANQEAETTPENPA